MGILDPLYNLLGTGPGAFVYHLLILLALEGAAVSPWWSTDIPEIPTSGAS
jgi:hypothetical protein